MAANPNAAPKIATKIEIGSRLLNPFQIRSLFNLLSSWSMFDTTDP